MTGAPEYPVGTFAKMVAIPLEARERFLAELPALLDTADRILSLQGIVGDEAEVILGEPTWVDDGATNATVNISVQDADGTSIAKSTTTFDHALASKARGETPNDGSIPSDD